MGNRRSGRDGVAGPCEEGVVLGQHPVHLPVKLNDTEGGIRGVCRYQTGEGRGRRYLNRTAGVSYGGAGGAPGRTLPFDTEMESAEQPAGRARVSTMSRLPAEGALESPHRTFQKNSSPHILRLAIDAHQRAPPRIQQ